MGIYDREYYRREGPSFLGSFTEQGKACKWIIGINVVLFVAQVLFPSVTSWIDLRAGVGRHLTDEELIEQHPEFFPEWEEMPGLPKRQQELQHHLFDQRREQLLAQLRQQYGGSGVLQGQVWRLLTYAFAHSRGDVFHILFNMLFLWWFGHEMEELYGAREFTLFYLASALVGGIGYFVWALARGTNIPCVGASGAVTAVMVLYAFHYPTRVIRLMFFLPVPIWLFVAFQVAQDLFVFASGQDSTVAVAVHLAGAAFGFGYYKRNWRLTPLWQAVTSLRLPKRRPRVRVYEEEDETSPPRRPQPASPAPTGITTAPSAPASDEHLEAQVDAVLEKVARSGRDSLTEHEKALLVRASEVYKRRQRL
jgi:membrane associated rhomboid family serine protease